MFKTFPVISFFAYGAILLISLFAGLYTDNFIWFLVPFGLVVAGIGITNIRFLYYCLLFFLPLSIEVQLSGGFATDFPDELLMVGLMFLTLAYLLANRDASIQTLYTNPIFLLLVFHYVWIIFSAVTSSMVIVSMKYALAKMWYLITFVVLTVILVRRVDDFKTMFWIIMFPLLGTVAFTMARHAVMGFSFASVNHMMWPFFRNHVNYAAMLSIWLPFVWLATTWYKRNSATRYFLILSGLVLIVALGLSYTRSGWLAAAAAVVIAIVIRYRLVRVVVGGGFVALIAGVFYLKSQNRFLDYAPNFDKTVYHENLDEHLTSTYKLEDISSAERVYRWVAGFKMWDTHPWVGYGTGNFYNFYKSHTVTAFQTYVSDNPEKSTVHNYFLLILVEQGIIGFVLFTLLTLAIFIYGEKLYHRVTDKADQRWVLAILMSLAAVYINNMLSDLIETDKIGSIYFIDIAMLMVLMHKYPSLKKPGSKNADVVAE